MSRPNRGHPAHQGGTILVAALVVIAGVATIAAGTMVAIRNNTVAENEQLRQMQGISIADAARTSIAAGWNLEEVQKRVTGMYDATGPSVTCTDDGTDDIVKGSIGSEARQYGYRFSTAPDVCP